MSQSKRVHILSEDGTIMTTRVLYVETGEIIPNVYRVSLHLDANDDENKAGLWKAAIYTFQPVIDVKAMAFFCNRCPTCHQDIPNDPDTLWEEEGE